VDVFILGSEGLRIVFNTLLTDPSTTVFTHPEALDIQGLLTVRNPAFSSAPIQLVFGCLGMTAGEVLSNFDMDACSVQVTGHAEHAAVLNMLPSVTMGAWRSKVARITNPHLTTTSRVLNMRHKGFAIMFADPEMATDPAFRTLAAALRDTSLVPPERFLKERTQAMLRLEEVYVGCSPALIMSRLRCAVRGGVATAARRAHLKVLGPAGDGAGKGWEWYGGDIDAEHEEAAARLDSCPLLAADPSLRAWV
jgi:hypothetical protein